MTYTILLFVTRKEGMAPLEFKYHFEKYHVPLVLSTTGSSFPKQHSRRYIHRSLNESANLPESDNSNAKWPATSFFGPVQEIDYDAIVELVFDDEAGCNHFFEIIKQEDAQQKLAEDEEMFLDREKLTSVVLGDVIVNDM